MRITIPLNVKPVSKKRRVLRATFGNLEMTEIWDRAEKLSKEEMVDFLKSEARRKGWGTTHDALADQSKSDIIEAFVDEIVDPLVDRKAGLGAKRKTAKGWLKIIVSSHPNPDLDEVDTPAPREEFEAQSYADLSRFARNYIEKNNLGAGNFRSEIWKGGKRFGHVSYNGRVWKGDPMGKSVMVYPMEA